jgi:hypothetical protein
VREEGRKGRNTVRTVICFMGGKVGKETREEIEKREKT